MKPRPMRRGAVWRASPLLVVMIGLGAAGPVRAQPAPAPSERASPQDAAAFDTENKFAMDRMMVAMEVKPAGDLDQDFVAMMRPHHQGAIDMAQAYLRHGQDEALRRIAQEIIVEQQQEIAAMNLAVGEPPPSSAPAPTQATPPSPSTAGAPVSAPHHHHATNR